MTLEESFNLLVRRTCRCKDESTTECDKCSKAYDMVENVILNNAKYAWHDLRNNPNDLPIYEKPYLCVIETLCKTLYEPKSNKEYTILGRYQILNLKEFVVAWREIEPFEVTE